MSSKLASWITAGKDRREEKRREENVLSSWVTHKKDKKGDRKRRKNTNLPDSAKTAKGTGKWWKRLRGEKQTTMSGCLGR